MVDVPVVIEVERVVNLVRGFGWEKTEERIDKGQIVIVLRKTINVPSPGTPE